MHRAPTSCGHHCARALLWIFLSAGAAAASAAPSYTLTDLAALQPGHPNVVRGPNNQGRAGGGGRLVDDRGPRRGLIFEGGPVAQQVAGAAGSENSTIYRINDGGTFVGSANSSNGLRAFAGSTGGATRELPPLPGDTNSAAFGINNLGQATGFSSGPGGQRAVTWNAGGTPAALPAVAGASSSRGNDISTRGDVAGLVSGDAGDRPVLWPAGQAATELQLIPGDSTGEARAVNATGDAVGYTGSAGGVMRHAALWTSAGLVTSLGALPGGEFSEAFGINDSGAVVGTTSSSAGRRAFLWTRTGGIQDLNTLIPPLHVVLTKAVGINNAGAIVAVGHAAPPGQAGDDHAFHDAPLRVFLLRPVGAP
ncbi:hypothetical protein [Ramlibacter henchirensis]|nr:hypothetical protein [Ramlibacter henchirensis]